MGIAIIKRVECDRGCMEPCRRTFQVTRLHGVAIVTLVDDQRRRSIDMCVNPITLDTIIAELQAVRAKLAQGGEDG